jgi:uncharacterized protein
MSPLRRPISILFGLLCLAGAAQIPIPQPQSKYVSDYANVLTLEDQRAIEDELYRVEEQTGIEITVVTIDQIADYDASEPPIESFAKTWFNTWGVGKAASNDGVLLLMSVKDRKCRIELGGGYPKEMDRRMEQVMQGDIIPAFKNGQYSTGLRAGAHGIVGAVTIQVTWFEKHKWPAILGILALLQILVGLVLKAFNNPWWSGVMIFGVIFLIIAVLWLYFTSGSQSTSGFGGGFSSGGGATGSW